LATASAGLRSRVRVDRLLPPGIPSALRFLVAGRGGRHHTAASP